MRNPTRVPSVSHPALNWRASISRLRASATIRKSIGATLLAMLASSAIPMDSARAATLTYDADGNPNNNATDGTGVWDTTTTNWYNGTTDVIWPNTTADTAVFGAGALLPYTVTVGAVNAGAITFNQGGYTLAGGTITLGGTNTITTNGGTDTINSVLALANGTFTKTGSGTLVIGSNVTVPSGTPLVTTTGGTFISSLGIFDSILQAANAGTIAGTAPSTTTTEYILNAGTLRFTQNAGALLGPTRGVQINAAGGALVDGGTASGGTGQIGGPLTFNAGTSSTNLYLSNLAGATTTFTNTSIISGTGNVVWNGLGTGAFQAADTYTGSTTVNSGTLSIQSTLASPSLILGGGTLAYAPGTAGTLNFASGGTTVNAGQSAVSVTAGNTLALGAITRNAGTLLSFGTTGTTTTSTAVNGIVGPYAFTGTGTTLSYVTGGGTVAAYSGTPAATAANVTDTTGTVNYDLAASGAFGTGASVNTVRSTGAAVTATGNLTTNGIMNAGTGLLTLSGNITIGSNNSLPVLSNTLGVTLSGVISNGSGGASTLTYGGASAGTLTLSGYNTYTGGTFVDGGTLAIAKGGGTAGVLGAITVNPGATLSLTVGDALGYSNAGTSVSVINVNGGTVSNSGGNEGSFTSFNLTAGTVSSTGGTYIINTTANGITSNASRTTSTFSAPVQGQNGGTNLVVTTAAGNTASGVDLLMSGVISANQTTIGLTKAGAGYLSLTNGGNTFAGPVLVSSGTLNIGTSAGSNTGSTSALGVANAGKSITVSSGATLSGASNNLFGNASNTGTLPVITLNGGTFTTSRYTTIGALNLNAGSLLNNETADTNTYQSFALRGNVTVGGSAPSLIASTTVTATTGGVHLGANTQFTVADATGDSRIDLTVSTPLLNQSGDFSNAAGGFTKLGLGTMALTGANTYTGATTISAGTLQLGNGGTAGTLSTSSTITDNGNLTVNRSNAVLQGTDFSTSAITGTGTLTLAGTGTLTLTAANSYTGATTINAGSTLQLGNAGTVGALSPSSAITDNGNLTFNRTDSITQGTDFGTAAITGTGSLTQAGSGTLTLTAANTYSGATSVNSGILYVNGSLNTGGTVSVASGARLGGTGTAGTATIASGGNVEAGQNKAGKLTLSGLTFSGTSTVFFGNLSNYTSTPAIAAGALTANGAANSVTLTINGTIPSGVGTYQLLSYTGGSIGGPGGQSAFALATPLPNRATGSLDFSQPGLVDLNITGSDFLIYTGGTTNTFDTTNPNFKLNSNGAPATYIDSPADTVVFDDSAGAGHTTVTVSSGDVHPTSVTFNNSAFDYTLQGTFAIAGGTLLNKNGTGALIVTNANTYTGATLINAGTIQIGNGGTTGALPAASAITDNGALVFNRSNAVLQGADFSTSSITGSGSLTQAGAGKLTLTAANSYTGATTINAGTILQVGNAGTSGALSPSSAVTDNGNLTFNRTDSITQGTQFSTAAIAGSGSLTQAGTGNVTLNVAETYAGGTTVNAGTLTLGAGGGSGNVQGAIAVNTGGTLNLAVGDALGYTAGSQVTAVNMNGGTVTSTAGNNEGFLTNFNLTGGTVAAGSTFRFNVDAATPPGITSLASGTTSTFASPIDDFPASGSTTNSLGIAVASGTTASGIDLTISGVISSLGGTVAGITKTGSGTLALMGANTFTGPTNVNAGTLVFSGAGGLYSTGTVAGNLNVNSGATVQFNRNDALGGSGVVSPVVVTVNGGTLASNNTYTSLSNPVFNGATITSNGGTSVAFPGFSFRGTVNVGGTTATNINVGTGNNNNVSLGTFNNTSPGDVVVFNVADATNSVAPDLNVNTFFSNQSTGTVGNGLTKGGSGTIALNGANTYTGATTVNGGTLLVNGSTAGGAVTVSTPSGPVGPATAAILGGTGTVSGATTINTGGKITGADVGTVGTLTLQSTLTLTGGTYAVDISADGTTADRLNITGALTLTNANITFNGTPTLPSYVLATFGSEAGALFSGTAPAGYAFQFNDAMTPTELDLVAVPEPATWLAGCLLVGLTGLSQRRRINGWLNLARI